MPTPTINALRRLTRLGHSYPLDVALGRIPDAQRVVFAGTNNNVDSTYALLAPGGVWQAPTPADAKPLRVKAGGDAADSPVGTGARLIELAGLDVAGAPLVREVATNGTAAGPATLVDFLRLNSARVVSSGSSGAPTVGSHAASIVIEAADGSGDWATISASPAPARGVSTTGAYSVPAGFSTFIVNIASSVQSNKSAHLLFFARLGMLEGAAPFTPWTQLFDAKGNTGTQEFPQEFPIGPLVGPCDIAVMGRFESTSGELAVSLTLLLVPEG